MKTFKGYNILAIDYDKEIFTTSDHDVYISGM